MPTEITTTYRFFDIRAQIRVSTSILSTLCICHWIHRALGPE